MFAHLFRVIRVAKKLFLLLVEKMLERRLQRAINPRNLLDPVHERLNMMLTERQDNKAHLKILFTTGIQKQAYLNVGFDKCFSNKRCAEESPERDKRVTTNDSSKIEQRVW